MEARGRRDARPNNAPETSMFTVTCTFPIGLSGVERCSLPRVSVGLSHSRRFQVYRPSTTVAPPLHCTRTSLAAAKPLYPSGAARSGVNSTACCAYFHGFGG